MRFLRLILPGAIIAAIFWFLSAQPFVDRWNEIPLVQQLALNFRTTFVTIGAIALMFPAIKGLFVKPLNDAMDERTKRLEDTYSEAESLKQHMAALKTSYEQKLAASEAEAREKIRAAIGDAQATKDQILTEARTQAEEIRTRNETEMERERQKMLVGLRTHVADLALLATEKIISENLDDERQRKLIDRFIDTAEVGR
ncbi:MAG: F0F1 ATP synthase subunit B [Armatimonadetes bacterium]|nr:F0F1 ATP synthase subunit B [Armatimonadota bacterium]